MSDDIFSGTNGDDAFNGGEGTDTVTFAGNAAGYRFGSTGDGRLYVVDIDLSNGDTGTDILTSIETLSFLDKSYSVAVEAALQPQGIVDVNSYEPSGTSHGQSDQAITALADGGYVITWTSDEQDGSDTGIYAQRYDAGGNPLGPETRVNTYTSLFQDAPAVTGLPDGGYMITWASFDFGDSNTGIYAQRYDASGNATGAEIHVNASTDSRCENPAIAVLSNGGYVITWYGDDDALYAQRFDATGASVGAEVTINNDDAMWWQGAPEIAALADGGYVICYSHFGNSADIFAKRYDADGNIVGAEFRVNSLTTNDQQEPAITALSGGGFVIAWQSGLGSNGGDIYIRRYDADGNAIGAQVRVNDTTAADALTPSIATLANGGFVVAWAANDELYTQRFDANGNSVGAETVINSRASWEIELSPTVTGLPDGSYVISWAGEYEDGIYAQRFDAQGKPWGPLAIKLIGTSGNDVINGGEGTQRMEGLVGNDTLDGGAGDDAAVYAGSAGGYRIDYLSSGQIRVVDIDPSNGNTGSDILTNIEGLKFSDKTYRVADSDFLVSSPVGEAQENASVTVLEDGSYIIAWQKGDGTSWQSEVYSQHYAANGNILGAPKLLSMGTDWGNENPVTAVLEGGGYVIAYAAVEGDGRVDSGIFFRRFDAAGNLVGNEVKVNANSGFDEGGPTITALADGGFVVTWTVEMESSGDSLYAQRFNASGSKVGAQVLVAEAGGVSEGFVGYSQSVVAVAGGGYIVVWDSVTDNGMYGRHDIYAKRFDAAGNVVMDDTLISGNAPQNSVDPDIATFANGAYVIAWTSYNETTESYEIHAQRFNAAGQLVGAEVQVNTTTDYDQSAVSIAVLKGGGYVLAWQSYDWQENTFHGIYAQRYDSNGNKVGSETRINVETTGRNSNPEVAALDNGGYAITWTAKYDDVGEQVCAQRFDAAGNMLPTANSKIIGTSGNDVIRAGGQQVLFGLAGDDVYVLGQTNNRIVESTGGGNDLVQASVDYTLGANIERLVLTGAGDIDGKGNALNNTLTGNGGNNVLEGGAGNDNLIGGAGDDILIDEDQGNDNHLTGGTGNDIYQIAGLWDTVITELAGGGTDTVRSWLSCSLATATNVENLTLTGTENLSGTGNTLNNTLTGNSANNVLNGGGGNDILYGAAGNDVLLGGAGNDRLSGSAGSDTFRFNTTPNGSTNFDTIIDYVAANDTIQLENAIFTKLTVTGTLNALNFRANNTGTAGDSNDFILYETDTGKLFYDADGSGAGGKILFAIIGTSTHPVLTASEIVVI